MVRQKTVAEGAEVVWRQDPCLSRCKTLGGTHCIIWKRTLPHSLPCGHNAFAVINTLDAQMWVLTALEEKENTIRQGIQLAWTPSASQNQGAAEQKRVGP